MAKRTLKKDQNIHPIGKKLLWVEEDKNIWLMIKLLGGFCALLVLANLFIHLHGHFSIEAIPGFYGVYGFIAFAFIVIATKYLRELIGREEDYYAPNVVDPEAYPQEGLEKKDYGDV